MSIDFSKQNNLQEKIEIVKQLFKRFNDNYGDFIDMNIADEAFSNTIIVTKYDGLPKEIKLGFDYGNKGQYFEGKIYVKETEKIDTIVHEALHYITKENGGIVLPVAKSYDDDKYVENIKKFGENRTVEQVGQLNEAFTRFLTELIVPEIEIKDQYYFGAGCLRKLYGGLKASNLDTSFLFKMYFEGTQDSVKKFMDSFGDDFYDLIDVIEQHHNMGHYFLKQKEPTISDEQVNLMIKKAVLEAKKQSLGNIDNKTIS